MTAASIARAAAPAAAPRRLTTALATLVLGALFTVGCLPAAQADTWPSRPLRLVVPFPPGGAADAIGRLTAARLSDRLGKQVIVENKPGGGTIIAAQAVAQSAPDGYTLSLATTGQLAINPHLHAKLPYDPVKSFTPVALIASSAYILAVPAESPIQSLGQLVEAARRQPGVITYSSCGNGTGCHLTGEVLQSAAGIDLTHVPFQGSAPAITAVVGKQVQLASDTVAITAPQIQAGKLRGLAISGPTRSAAAPGVPTAAQAGVPGFLSDTWFGIVVPAGTPSAIVNRLAAELDAIKQQPDVREQLARQGLEVLSAGPEAFAKVIDADIAKWGRVVKVTQASAH
jgi:tripartite-type tricarboxylate transporter receptor subunit TctC